MSVLDMNSSKASERPDTEARPTTPLLPGRSEPVDDQPPDVVDGDALLRHRIAIPDGHGPILEGLDVDGAEGTIIEETSPQSLARS